MKERKLLYGDAITGLFLLLLSIVFGLITLQLDPRIVRYPQIVLVILGILSSCLIIKEIRKKDKSVKQFYWINIFKTILLFAVIYIYLTTIDLIGFVTASTLLMIVLMMISNSYWKWYWILTSSLLTAILIYFVFGQIFYVPLP
ncbi:tripartite tricarboxylate transporter TctB family protein [Salinibacillus xinjiangensis]|uniref:DUF1468 domain-containing protein n=1 Tax=Salinibacillus xinjiangensis TaxID=1229268 RepID=A0A6G1X1I2_9BACI|nr:tripartite tricarboxylate transporter TctB family protein [Salinibacillus xinjiangensis]MRG84851.1 hypothetical protein [Salinibacillus xinjiangensis]